MSCRGLPAVVEDQQPAAPTPQRGEQPIRRLLGRVGRRRQAEDLGQLRQPVNDQWRVRRRNPPGDVVVAAPPVRELDHCGRRARSRRTGGWPEHRGPPVPHRGVHRPQQSITRRGVLVARWDIPYPTLRDVEHRPGPPSGAPNRDPHEHRHRRQHQSAHRAADPARIRDPGPGRPHGGDRWGNDGVRGDRALRGVGVHDRREGQHGGHGEGHQTAGAQGCGQFVERGHHSGAGGDRRASGRRSRRGPVRRHVRRREDHGQDCARLGQPGGEVCGRGAAGIRRGGVEHDHARVVGPGWELLQGQVQRGRGASCPTRTHRGQPAQGVRGSDRQRGHDSRWVLVGDERAAGRRRRGEHEARRAAQPRLQLRAPGVRGVDHHDRRGPVGQQGDDPRGLWGTAHGHRHGAGRLLVAGHVDGQPATPVPRPGRRRNRLRLRRTGRRHRRAHEQPEHQGEQRNAGADTARNLTCGSPPCSAAASIHRTRVSNSTCGSPPCSAAASIHRTRVRRRDRHRRSRCPDRFPAHGRSCHRTSPAAMRARASGRTPGRWGTRPSGRAVCR